MNGTKCICTRETTGALAQRFFGLAEESLKESEGLSHCGCHECYARLSVGLTESLVFIAAGSYLSGTPDELVLWMKKLSEFKAQMRTI